MHNIPEPNVMHKSRGKGSLRARTIFLGFFLDFFVFWRPCLVFQSATMKIPYKESAKKNNRERVRYTPFSNSRMFWERWRIRGQ